MKILKLFLLILISLTFSNQVFSEDKILESLNEGGKIIYIRHAYAPGGGDPENFNINDCSTQRNLNDEGISQSKLIGEFFKTKKIKIDKVLSSEWCRCKDNIDLWTVLGLSLCPWEPPGMCQQPPRIVHLGFFKKPFV